ncbi:MerR family transcriptional regulator [Eggerthella guodeyinii]|uniref:MerR family transcriptional regulator n=1 Tax=Eggerthella guodeyinii TaxID=2690837 RepID=A0A6L7IV07_9ACTN|nr:MerR family transcriptional regulator [Eggerthella guodeyinii]QOS68681.1 MerR family transcriptional regulator [Eggerthella guodeyinii]
MRNDLLSIGEVAHLKGVGVKALRYYERIGILRPAYVNPDTGYRYYALRQMNELDVIVSCVQLGVPLKELADYVSERGVMDISSLLERAHALAKEKLRATQAILMELDGYRSEIAVQDALRTSAAPYERALGERTFLAMPWSRPAFDAKRYTKAMSELYGETKRAGIAPLFLQGMICLPGEGASESAAVGAGTSWYVALEVRALPGERLVAPPQERGMCLLDLPGGTFRGRRVERETFELCYREVFEEAQAASGTDAPETLLAFEVWDAELRTDRTIVEVLRG